MLGYNFWKVIFGKIHKTFWDYRWKWLFRKKKLNDSSSWKWKCLSSLNLKVIKHCHSQNICTSISRAIINEVDIQKTSFKKKQLESLTKICSWTYENILRKLHWREAENQNVKRVMTTSVSWGTLTCLQNQEAFFIGSTGWETRPWGDLCAEN